MSCHPSNVIFQSAVIDNQVTHHMVHQRHIKGYIHCTMYHGNTDTNGLSTLLPNLYHDNRFRLSVPITPCYLHIPCRGKHSFHHILVPNMCNENRLAGSMLTTLIYLTCTMITKEGIYFMFTDIDPNTDPNIVILVDITTDIYTYIDPNI